MPMNEQKLLERDAKRDIGLELLASVQEMQVGQVGAVHHVSVPVIDAGPHKKRENQP